MFCLPSGRVTMSKTDYAEIITRAVESDEVDYKAHQSWNTMTRTAKAKIVRHLAAFANTRGGYLVIGVGEDNSGYPGVLQGLTDEESASFDPSKVGAFVKNYIEPPIDFTIERPLVNGKRFAVFAVKPFSTMPHVCCQAVEHELREGVFYIRTKDASSRPATRAFELQQLIQRALRNQREMLGRMLRGILYETNSTMTSPDQSGVVEQIHSACEYFNRRRKPDDGQEYAFVRLTVIPDGKQEYPVSAMLGVVADEHLAQIFEEDVSVSQIHEVSVGIRRMSENSRWMWQAFKNGSFVYVSYVKLSAGALDLEQVNDTVCKSLAFASRFASSFRQEERLYSVRLEVTADVPVDFSSDGRRLASSGSNSSTAEICRSAADLASAPEVHAARLIRKFAAGLEEYL